MKKYKLFRSSLSYRKRSGYLLFRIITSDSRPKKHFTQAGIQSADIVILNGDYTLSAIASLLALFELKAIVAPVAIDAENERQLRIEASKAQWEIDTQPDTKITRLQSETNPHSYIQTIKKTGEAGLILFSSGSTGEPKAMIHSAERLL